MVKEGPSEDIQESLAKAGAEQKGGLEQPRGPTVACGACHQ